MSKVSNCHTSRKQLVGPILCGNVPEDRALWHLSLILVEIAEKQQTVAPKTGPQPQVDVEDKIIRNTD